MMNPAFIKIMAPWILGSVAVFALLFLIQLAVGDDPTAMALTLTVGVVTILLLLVCFNALKNRM